jgi:hypothetical protein
MLKIIDQSPEKDFMSSFEADLSKSDTGQTVLHLSASLGFARLLQEFIARGVHLDQPDVNGFTALHFSALFGHLDCVRSLVHGGADADIVSVDGHTAFDIALDSNHHTIADFLGTHMMVAGDMNDFSSGQGDNEVLAFQDELRSESNDPNTFASLPLADHEGIASP